MGAYRLSSKGACTALALSMLLAACGGGGGGDDTPNNPPPPAQTWSAAGGTAEKGPLITGSIVTAQELDAALSPTGKQYSYQISSDLGDFSPTSAFTSQYIGVSATGYYFDEVLGAVSSGPVTLNGYSDLSVDNLINVNILTTLAYQRIRNLVVGGKSFTEARSQAEGEVLRALMIPEGTYGVFGGLKISGTSDGAKLLAAISALFVEGNNSGEVSQLINNFQSDIGLDGSLDDSTTQQALAAAALALRPDRVAANLNQRFASLGVTFTVDDISRWIDGNGNKWVGEPYFDVLDANESTLFTLPPSAIAFLINRKDSIWSDSGDLYINGNPVGRGVSRFINFGDVVQVSPSDLSHGVGYASVGAGVYFDVVRVNFFKPFDSVEVTPQGKQLKVGETVRYSAIVHFLDGSSHDLTTYFRWSSSNPAVAEISDRRATYHALSLGTTTITATFGSTTASAALEVVPVVLEDFAVAPASMDIGIGMNIRARLTGSFTDGSTQDITPQATWRSVDPAIASVDSQTGVVSGVALGTTSIEATVDSITRSLTVNVTADGHAAGPALNSGRISHTATVLADGKILVAGGDTSQPGIPVTGEIYDPVTGAWTLTGVMAHQHGNHEATRLANGHVLLTGGYGNGPSTPFADIYNPATNQWTSAASMQESRIDHTSSILPDGKVLVAGGQHDVGSSFATTEIYDPATNTWAAGPNMGTARSIHTATVFADGRIFVVGGRDRIGPLADSSVTATAELYDPATNSWSAKAPMNHARMGHSATLLPDGRVLIAGGVNITNEWQPPEIYDPVADAWSSAGTMATLRAFHTATLLPDGKVMVAGGVTSDGSSFPSTATVEAYDPATNSWSPMESLGVARRFHTATRLQNEAILIVGGSTEVPPYTLASTELYW